MPRKVYVDVIARFTREGEVAPLSIQWEDGEIYEIDRILDIRRAASPIVGGFGVRYTCRIRGRETYLFRELDRFFVEGKYASQ